MTLQFISYLITKPKNMFSDLVQTVLVIYFPGTTAIPLLAYDLEVKNEGYCNMATDNDTPGAAGLVLSDQDYHKPDGYPLDTTGLALSASALLDTMKASTTLQMTSDTSQTPLTSNPTKKY